MKAIEDDLEHTGEEFRRAADALRSRQWQENSLPSTQRRRLLLATAAVGVALLAVGLFAATTRQGSVEVAAGVVAGSEDLPFLLLEAEGWGVRGHFEHSYEPVEQGETLVFRAPASELGAPTVTVTIATGEWSAGQGAERIDLEGRQVSVIDRSILPSGHAAGIEFDSGPTVVAEGFGLDRDAFVEMVSLITLSPSGDPVVVPPAGFDRVLVGDPWAETVIQRETSYEGPNGSQADVRVWFGTSIDVEQQAMSRAIEAQSVQATTLAQTPALITHHSHDLSRIFVVGGSDGYVIEIDLRLLGPSATDEQLGSLLESLGEVDLATFEAALPEGVITRAETNAAIAEMLSDIPLPSGFDASRLTSKGDRYQTGAHVAGAVVCAWLDLWVDARSQGATEQANQAANALATSRNWAILLEMQDQGAYPQVVWQYADAIAEGGTVKGGRTLTVEESYQDAFGCATR